MSPLVLSRTALPQEPEHSFCIYLRLCNIRCRRSTMLRSYMSHDTRLFLPYSPKCLIHQITSRFLPSYKVRRPCLVLYISVDVSKTPVLCPTSSPSPRYVDLSTGLRYSSGPGIDSPVPLGDSLTVPRPLEHPRSRSRSKGRRRGSTGPSSWSKRWTLVNVMVPKDTSEPVHYYTYRPN